MVCVTVLMTKDKDGRDFGENDLQLATQSKEVTYCSSKSREVSGVGEDSHYLRGLWGKQYPQEGEGFQREKRRELHRDMRLGCRTSREAGASSSFTI